MIYTFLFTLILNAAVGLKTRIDSLILMVVFAIIIGLGAVLFWFVKVILKRRLVESGQPHESELDSPEVEIEIQTQNSKQPISDPSENPKSQRQSLLKK